MRPRYMKLHNALTNIRNHSVKVRNMSVFVAVFGLVAATATVAVNLESRLATMAILAIITGITIRCVTGAITSQMWIYKTSRIIQILECGELSGTQADALDQLAENEEIMKHGSAFACKAEQKTEKAL